MRVQFRKNNLAVIFCVFGCMSLSSVSHAEPVAVRWTEAEDGNGNIDHILEVISQKTGFPLHATDFTTIENRKLATSKYLFLAQNVDGVPVHGASVRIWKYRQGNRIIQVEANVENPAPIKRLAALPANDAVVKRVENTETANKVVLQAVQNYEDKNPARITTSQRFWKGGQLVQIVKVKARRGYHKFIISLSTKKILSHKYEEFPQDDPSAHREFSLRANLYQIYEEPEQHIGQILPRVPTVLKYLKRQVRKSDGADPYAALRSQHYFYDKFDPILGLTQEGRDQGFWSMTYLKEEAKKLRDQLPLVDNSFDNGGAILEGRYATVSLHPAAKDAFQGISFPLNASLQFMPSYKEVVIEGHPNYEMIPGASLLGKPMLSNAEVYNRPARRLQNHDPVSYINDGFDELQVYYSINALMDSLHDMGFNDPELSTRPFNAFLYDPDISMRDNAYYTDDTINFTTYSADAQNYARDNSTIWHELGHGIMDRLMGDSIVLADTGGLSEGMADFVASLVIADRMEGQTYPGMNEYRIINNTGFHLTNEVHDDGEAYGGTMDDIKIAAIARDGRAGLKKVTDLTLETMRLTRNNPGLTASGWFEHMLFADSRGSNVRQKGELHNLIVNAYSGRNFSLDENVKIADLSLKYDDQEVVAGSPGSRSDPLPVTLAADGKANFQLHVSLKDGEAYKFNYPVTGKALYRTGALEGAIHWEGEEAGPKTFTVESEGQSVAIDVTATGKCDEINREDGSCVDYIYVQIFKAGAEKPIAKKRFYVQVHPS